MANIILINDQDQEQTLAGVSKLVTRSTDGEAVFSAGGQGGGNVDFGLTVGETYETIYFNTMHDTAALDAALAAADYPNTLTINGTAYPSNTMLAFDDKATAVISLMPRIDIVDLSAVAVGAYAIWAVRPHIGQSIVYCTANVELATGESIVKGWAMASWLVTTYKGILTGILDTFSGVKDSFFSGSLQAYGDFLAKVSAPRITVVPVDGDVQFELNDSSQGSNDAIVDIQAFADDQYTHDVADLLGGKLKVLTLPDVTWEDEDSGAIHIVNGWEYTAGTGLVGKAEWYIDAANKGIATTTIAKIKNNSNAAVKFRCTWTAKYLRNSYMSQRGVFQVGANVRQGNGTHGPYALTQNLSPGKSLTIAVTSGVPKNPHNPKETDGRMTITLTDFAEIT